MVSVVLAAVGWYFVALIARRNYVAQLIIVNKEQLAASLARFEKILADDATEQERLRQLQKDAQAAPKLSQGNLV